MNTVIKTEKIGKKYFLTHQEKQPYHTLRDVVVETVTRWANKMLHPFNTHSSGFTKSSHEEFWALKDISFEINQGDRVGIIGRNGAGKSTLLKILSRITDPSEGRISIKGRVASLLEVGTGFHPELTGRENVYLNGAILGMTKTEIKRKFDEIVSFAEVERFLDTPVKRYSSGMYVRLAFAVAAHLEPEILVVDEVLAVGDAQFQKKCLGKMEQVGKEGRTVLFVSHNLGAVQRLCRKSILLEHGILVEQGNTQLVIKKYLSSRADENTVPDKLGRFPRKAGLGGLIKFSKCFILNSKGERTNRLLFSEHFTVVVQLNASAPVSNLSVIVGIDTVMEYRITTLASEDGNVLFNARPDDPLSIHARVDELILKPGVYTITLGLRSGRVTLDHLTNIVQFEVMELAELAGGKQSVDFGSWGAVHVSAHWTEVHTEVNSAQINGD